MATNYFKGTFTNANGKKITKEFTSSTKSSTQLQKEAKESMGNKGYKYSSGSMGTKSK